LFATAAVVVCVGALSADRLVAGQMYAGYTLQCGSSLVSSPLPTYSLSCANSGIAGLGYYFRWNGHGGWNTGADGYNNSHFLHGAGTHIDQWGAGTSTATLAMQSDGNFVLYNNSSLSAAIWETNTDGFTGAYVNAQDDGNLVVYSSSNSPLWSVY
jgi:hypothetical protein